MISDKTWLSLYKDATHSKGYLENWSRIFEEYISVLMPKGAPFQQKSFYALSVYLRK